MSTRIYHDEYELLVVLFPDEQPVRLDVTLPLTFTIVLKLMRTMFSIKRFTIEQFVYNSLQLLHG